jgi:hypothetical protein
MPQHDYEDHSGYHQQCDCHDCKSKYNEWCNKNKTTGKACCRIKKVTHYTIQCSQPVTTVYNYGWEEEKKSDWKPHKAVEHPKNCKSCGRSAKHCKCNQHGNKHGNKHSNRHRGY